MKKGKKKHLIFANICCFFHKLWNAIKSVFVYESDKLKLNVNDTSEYGYVDLGPTDDAKNVSEYMRALEWALNDDNITNIALAGPFGAGKSSIINTFLNKHPSIKYIKISLAAFRDNSHEKIKKNDLSFEKELEEGMLKQLFYKEQYSRIPQSRYRKLHKVSFLTSFIRVILTILLIISFVILFTPLKLLKLTKVYSKTMTDLLGWNGLYQILFASTMGIVIIFIMTILFRWINTKWKSIEINVADKAVIKADEKSETLSLNKNMDEILYFFEETDYTFVVIEDLDRFDIPVIYTKLREINKIINDYDAIQRRIVFVYALKDDIFYNEDRTKFFDFIIPVVPYIDATNSGEYLKIKLDTLKIMGHQFEISDDYIMNVAPFISDMRVLNNICNEFIVYKKTIKDSQELIKLQDEQMFSIMIFKNMYPKEFAKLQEPDGIIKQAYNARSEFIEKITPELQKEIEKAEEEKKKSDDCELLCAEDVKLAFIMKLIGDKGIFTKIEGTKGTFTKKEILKGDFTLSQIGNGAATLSYQKNSGSSWETQCTINDIEKIKCSDGEMYFDKCDRAIARDKNYRKRIDQNLIDKQGEQYLLRSKTMKTLIKEYGANKVLGDEVTKNQLLVFMLRHGYIDDTYQMYINYFLPGSITVDELNFILNVRNYVGKTDWNNRVIHPNNVVSRLFDYELEQQKECLNFDLADYFYKDDKKSDKKTGFTKLLAKNDIDSKEFIKEYYVRANNKAEYIKNIAQQKLLFWYDICSDDSLVYKDKILYLKDLFMYLDIDDIVLQDTQADDKDPAYSICSFIVESDGVLELLQEAGAQKVVEVLIKVKAKLRNIDLDTVIPEIVRGIYENELFEISFLMLQKYVDFRIGEHVQDFRKNIFTFILGQEDVYVIKYLERNIQEFVSKIILPIEDNTNEDIDTVFRCIQLLDYDEKFSIQLVQKMDVVMKNLSEWISSTTDQKKDVRKIVDAFLVEDKIEASIDNLDTYKTKYQFSIELCKFVDRNIDALLADKNIDDAHVKEFLKKDIKKETVEKILQNYEMESFSDELNIYRDNVIRTMILLKYFKYTRSRYYEICSAFPGMFSLFVEHYWDEFETEIPNISVDLKIIDEVMKSNLKDEKKVIFLSKVDAIQMTDEMYAFVCKTDIKIPKKYLLATWNKLDVRDRPAFMVKHFSAFSIVEIQNMFAQMPEEYHALKQTYSRHEVLLEKNGINDSLCKKLLQTYYISSYDTKKVRSDLLTGDVEKYVARVKAKKRV